VLSDLVLRVVTHSSRDSRLLKLTLMIESRKEELSIRCVRG